MLLSTASTALPAIIFSRFLGFLGFQGSAHWEVCCYLMLPPHYDQSYHNPASASTYLSYLCIFYTAWLWVPGVHNIPIIYITYYTNLCSRYTHDTHFAHRVNIHYTSRVYSYCTVTNIRLHSCASVDGWKKIPQRYLLKKMRKKY